MDYTGLLKKFKINRLLTEDEQNERLYINKQTNNIPLPRRSVIGMNSNTLVICDKFFFDRGMATAIGLFGWVLFISTLVVILYIGTIGGRWNDPAAVLSVVFLFVVTAIIVLVSFFLLIRKECFSYTHYPIIFNRKTRKVHVFRQNGTVMTEDWDKLFFTLGEKHMLETRDVRGHKLSDDGKMVLETFSLPYYDFRERDTFFSMWEFIRRFMEDKKAPNELFTQVKSLLGVDKRRLGYMEALRLSLEYSSAII